MLGRGCWEKWWRLCEGSVMGLCRVFLDWARKEEKAIVGSYS
jgi:hypothetical protein